MSVFLLLLLGEPPDESVTLNMSLTHLELLCIPLYIEETDAFLLEWLRIGQTHTQTSSGMGFDSVTVFPCLHPIPWAHLGSSVTRETCEDTHRWESRLGLLQEPMQVANQGLKLVSRPGKTTEGAGDSWV